MILVTGGAGYIGSHTCVQLLEAGNKVIIVDNLSNSNEKSIERIEKITGKKVKFYKVDILDKKELDNIFNTEKIDSVIHFAGLKSVGQSSSMPLEYYQNNVNGTLVLLEVMQKHNVKNIIFSSSATVYGDPQSVPIKETAKTSTVNPYGTTKLVIEWILQDLYNSDNKWNIVILRYFNPAGAHESGLIGEDPKGIPNNLLPYITQVAIRKLKELSVFGNDYNTKDGTGVRDYIHVIDIATGHLKALDRIKDGFGLEIFNLGTGKGVSVLEMIKALEKASGKTIPYKIVARRVGDIGECYADCQKANELLNFNTKFDLDDMCRDSWNWQMKNPNGYDEF